MIPESYQITVLTAVFIALASLILVPVLAMNDRGDIKESFTNLSEDLEGISCALPPALDIEEGGAGLTSGPLPIDHTEDRALKTATFALG
jgi:hypothetical protein